MLVKLLYRTAVCKLLFSDEQDGDLFQAMYTVCGDAWHRILLPGGENRRSVVIIGDIRNRHHRGSRLFPLPIQVPAAQERGRSCAQSIDGQRMGCICMHT